MIARAYRIIAGISLASLGIFLVPPGAYAAPSCSINSTTGVAFGNYDVFSATPLDSAGSVVFTCKGNARNVTLILSRGNAPTYNPRYMLSGGTQMNYNLYTDTARTIIFGDGTGGTSRFGPINPQNNRANTVNIYGRIPAGQDLPVSASYTDTVVATVTY